MLWVIFFGFAALTFNLIFYVFLVPSMSSRPRFVSNRLGSVLYFITYVLSILRAPLSILPYLIKLIVFLLFKTSYMSSRNSYIREGIHVIRDFVNLVGITLLVWWLFGPPHIGLILFLYLPIAAEVIRLVCYRGQMLFSAFWQFIPHRKLAKKGLELDTIFVANYCQYYSLDNEERAEYLLAILKRWAVSDAEMLNCLSYISHFRIVPTSHALNGGHVRNIALGEVFVHPNWTNDPWLLIGLAIRRSPWIFDPRNLKRPFYYRTGSNVVVNRFIFRHFDYCIPYTIFQIGHQIKVARYDPFYRILRWLGFDIEQEVRMDGTYQYDQLMNWIGRRLGRTTSKDLYRPLWTDEETLNDVVTQLKKGEVLSLLDIATTYSYPLKYVEEVLWPRILEAYLTH